VHIISACSLLHAAALPLLPALNVAQSPVRRNHGRDRPSVNAPLRRASQLPRLASPSLATSTSSLAPHLLHGPRSTVHSPPSSPLSLPLPVQARPLHTLSLHDDDRCASNHPSTLCSPARRCSSQPCRGTASLTTFVATRATRGPRCQVRHLPSPPLPHLTPMY
jgi:hypothetical protein